MIWFFSKFNSVIFILAILHPGYMSLVQLQLHYWSIYTYRIIHWTPCRSVHSIIDVRKILFVTYYLFYTWGYITVQNINVSLHWISMKWQMIISDKCMLSTQCHTLQDDSRPGSYSLPIGQSHIQWDRMDGGLRSCVIQLTKRPFTPFCSKCIPSQGENSMNHKNSLCSPLG